MLTTHLVLCGWSSEALWKRIEISVFFSAVLVGKGASTIDTTTNTPSKLPSNGAAPSSSEFRPSFVTAWAALSRQAQKVSTADPERSAKRNPGHKRSESRTSRRERSEHGTQDVSEANQRLVCVSRRPFVYCVASKFEGYT